MVEIEPQEAKQILEEKGYEKFDIVGYNHKERSVIIDQYDDKGELTVRNNTVTLEDETQPVDDIVDQHNFITKNATRREIMSWLDDRNLQYCKWLPFKFLLMHHVNNYKIALGYK